MATENKSNRFQQFLDRLKHFSARDVVIAIENLWERLKAFIEKAQETFYRFVVLNDETFEEVGSYKLSLMNVYVLVSSLLVGFTILGMVLIAFTPLKRIVPGYGGYGSERTIFDLTNQVEKLEKQVKAQETYTANFKRLLTGNFETEEDMPKGSTSASVVDSNVNLEPTEEELMVRNGSGDFDEEEGESASGSAAPNTNVALKGLANNGKNAPLESMYLTAPVNGDINMPFSLDKKHYGVDIAAPKNTPIKAAADGFVISSDWTLETGNTIAIQHANNVVSFYKHNASLLKKVGDRVKAGEAIAIIGNTGELTNGPHLHFEIWKEGRPVNPAEYIRF